MRYCSVPTYTGRAAGRQHPLLRYMGDYRMNRVYASIALLALLAATLAGCGGGGGGGSSSASTLTLTGLVVDSSGEGVSGATITISTDARAVLQTTTASDGTYSLASVPVGSDLTVTISGTGITTRSWSGVTIDTTGVSASAAMYVTMPSGLPPAGSTTHILPDPDPPEITEGTAPAFTVQIKDSGGATLYNSFPAVWIVVGDIPAQILTASPYDSKYLALSAETVGAIARVTAYVLCNDASTPSDTITVTVVSSGDDDEPPSGPS